MGRHSAPDEDGDVLLADPSVRELDVDVPVGRRARHAAPDGDLVRTDVIEPELVERPTDSPPREVVDAVVVEDERFPVRYAGEPAPEESPAPPARKERASRVDLRLLRESSSLRSRCAAAVLLPFILYTIVLIVISRLDVYLFWIWIPAILAGILFGAQLDGAVKRAAAPPPAD